MPQRFLRPAIRTSQRWNTISHRAARLYVAILTLVDDYGRYDGRVSVLWGDAFSVWNEEHPDEPVSKNDTETDCRQLESSNMVEFYELEGKKFLQITQWQERARGKSRWPEPSDSKRLRNPAESCGILPPSPSPSPLAIEPRLVDAESDGDRNLTSKLKEEIGKHFKRSAAARWDYNEESTLCEVARRPDVLKEWEEIVQYRLNTDVYHRKSVLALLSNWAGELDKARDGSSKGNGSGLDPNDWRNAYD